MKLITRKGELDIPVDFRMTMERTNPFLSDQGDASVPASLPATPRNIAALGHKNRIDSAEIYTNVEEAILKVGPLQKRGQLVIDTISSDDGIDASFAIDSSDLYVKMKDKSLKKIFDEVSETFNSTAQAVSHLYGIYSTGNMSYNYNVFPVAVSPYETDGSGGKKTLRYQLVNEPTANGLVYESRTVHDGDKEVIVPEGYGIAPFLRLSNVLDILFVQLGYTVTYNVFNYRDLKYIVLLHNCADCLCNPDHKIYYRDLVPSCTVAEFLNWLLAKFHAQPIVDSEARTVRILLMEDMLGGEVDIDLTKHIEGRWKVTLQPKKRIVLTPSVTVAGEDDDDEEGSLESLTRPAAATVNEFVEKYGEYIEVDEDDWCTLTTDSPAVMGCVVLRTATGEFHALEINPKTGLQQTRRLGTNHFAYDRGNSDDTEPFEQKDTIPAMLCGHGLVTGAKKDVVPFIGECIHFHTSINGENEKDSQNIMVAQFRFNVYFAARTTGTTQKFIPRDASVGGVSLSFALTVEDMYSLFWRLYNELLLNQVPHLSARVMTSAARLMGADMALLKMADGQLLIPVKVSGSIGDLPVLADAEFILNKRFPQGIADTVYPPAEANGLVWRIEDDTNAVVEKVFVEHKWDIWNQCLKAHGIDDPGLCDPVDDGVVLTGSSINYDSTILNVGPPTYLGELRVVKENVTVRLECTVTAKIIQSGESLYYSNYDTLWPFFITYTLVAVSSE